MRRALALRGWSVEQVMNLTDVDDKIIKRAREQGKTITQVTEPVIEVFHRDREYLRIQKAIALAYLGRKADAAQEADAALRLQRSDIDGYSGPYNEHLAARVYLRAGQPDKALAILEHLLKIPYYLSPAWLGIELADLDARAIIESI